MEVPKMRAVIVYESMYGNTHLIAEAIARGMQPENLVTVTPVAEASRDLLEGADLVVVGGPTHVHGMSQAPTRQAAAEAVHKPGNSATLNPGAKGPGLREWFGSLAQMSGRAAAFDTRIAGPAVLTGRASRGIAKLLERHGFTLAALPKSFLVSSGSELVPGEEDRAQEWGALLAAKVTPAASAGAGRPH
jgi:hypothetical protein